MYTLKNIIIPNRKKWNYFGIRDFRVFWVDFFLKDRPTGPYMMSHSKFVFNVLKMTSIPSQIGEGWILIFWNVSKVGVFETVNKETCGKCVGKGWGESNSTPNVSLRHEHTKYTMCRCSWDHEPGMFRVKISNILTL